MASKTIPPTSISTPVVSHFLAVSPAWGEQGLLVRKGRVYFANLPSPFKKLPRRRTFFAVDPEAFYLSLFFPRRRATLLTCSALLSQSVSRPDCPSLPPPPSSMCSTFSGHGTISSLCPRLETPPCVARSGQFL